MRQPHTFLLTVLLDDQDMALLCGRVRFVATDQQASFNGMDELIRFVRVQIEKYEGGITHRAGPETQAQREADEPGE